MSKGVPGNRYVLEFGKLVVGNCETVRPFEISACQRVRGNIPLLEQLLKNLAYLFIFKASRL